MNTRIENLFTVTKIFLTDKYWGPGYREDLAGVFLDVNSARDAVESHSGSTSLSQGGSFNFVVIENAREGLHCYPPYGSRIQLWYEYNPEKERFVPISQMPPPLRDTCRFGMHL